MSKVLVTGASGFIGRHTLPLLVEKGLEVSAVCHNTNGPEIHPSGVRWFKTDLLQFKSVEELLNQVKPDYLLHLAWNIKGEYRTSPQNMDWLNSGMYLMHRFAQLGGKRAVFAGTCFEYNLEKMWNQSSEAGAECTPNTLYGVCKNSLYNILRKSDLGNVSWAWARPFYIYGPYEDSSRLIPTLVRSALTRVPFSFKYDGMQQVDYCYVQDVAEAFVELLLSHRSGAFNITSGNRVRILDLISKIESLADAPSGIIDIGKELALPLTIAGSNNRMLYEVGWTPKVDLDRGLTRLVQITQRQLLIERQQTWQPEPEWKEKEAITQDPQANPEVDLEEGKGNE